MALKIRDRVQTFVLNRKKKSIFGGGVMKPIALAYGSFIVSIIGFFLKLIAYLMTDSVALYADAVESIVNIVAAFFLIIAMSLSQKPADDSHHYGHHKAQYFSVLLESLFIFIAASTIFYDAFQSYMSPNALHFSLEGLLVNGLATSFNAAWGFFLLHRGKKKNAPALVADAVHLMTDVYSSLSVVIGLMLAFLTGLKIIDPLIAVCVGISLIWSGSSLAKEAIDGLMDASPSFEEVEKIKKILDEHADGSLEIHDLKVRRAANMLFIEFHLVVPGLMLVRDSHQLCDRIEQALEKQFNEVSISIHVEPEEYAKTNSTS